MSTENIKNLIDSIQIGDSIGTEQSFMAEMEAKLDTKLSEFRQEVSQTLFKESVEVEKELSKSDTSLEESTGKDRIQHHDNYKEWKHQADQVSDIVHDDAVTTTDSSESSHYKSDSGKIFAKWDHKKKRGTVNIRGNEV